MKRTMLGLAIASAIAIHAAPIQFSRKGRPVTEDPFKPNTRQRRKKQSPAARILEKAKKQRTEAGG